MACGLSELGLLGYFSEMASSGPHFRPKPVGCCCHPCLAGHSSVCLCLQFFMVDDIASKAVSSDPEHFSNRFQAALASNPAIFRRTKGPLQVLIALIAYDTPMRERLRVLAWAVQEYVNCAVGARALLPIQPAHTRLTCADDLLKHNPANSLRLG